MAAVFALRRRGRRPRHIENESNNCLRQTSFVNFVDTFPKGEGKGGRKFLAASCFAVVGGRRPRRPAKRELHFALQSYIFF